MTVFIQTQNRSFYYSCKVWFEAYGFIISNNQSDILIIDYELFDMNNRINLNDYSIIVVIAYNESIRKKLPNYVKLFLKPIDIQIMVEYLIELYNTLS